MGTAGLQARQGRRSVAETQAEVNKSQGSGNQAEGTWLSDRFKRSAEKRREQQAQEQAAAAALSAAEKAAQEKTASLAASVVGGASTTTNGYGTNTYIEGNPDQGDNQSQGDGDLSTSDTPRRRGGYRRDSGLRI